MEGSGNSQGVTEHELDLARTSKEAFDSHRHVHRGLNMEIVYFLLALYY